MHIKNKWKAEGALHEMTEKYEEISRKYILLNKGYENVTRKMMLINAQINTILNDFKNLRQMDIKILYSEILLFLNRHNSVLDAALYIKKDNTFSLKGVYGNSFDYEKELDTENNVIVRLCIEKSGIITIKDIFENSFEMLKADSVKIALPVIYKSDILGILLIREISFIAMNEYNLSLINTVTNLLSDIIYEKEFLPEASSENFYSKELLIYSGKYFYEKVYTYQYYVKKFPGYIFTLAFIRIINADLMESTILKIKENLFSSDFMAVLDDRNHIIGICLNLMDSTSQAVFERKLEQALKENLLNEDEYKIVFMEYTNRTRNPEIPDPAELNELLS